MSDVFPPCRQMVTRPEDVHVEKLCGVEEMKNGELREFTVKEKPVVVVNDNGTFLAMGGRCPHFDAPMWWGTYANGKLRCPYHGACFDMRTGDIEDYPGLDCLPSFQTKIENGDVYIVAKKDQLVDVKRVKPMVPPQGMVQRAPIVIVGGGPSSQVCAEVLRQEGFRGGIVILSAEKYLPYDRVRLTKMLGATPEAVCYRDETFFKKHHIDVRLNSRVEGIDSEAKIVTLENGAKVEYSKLVLAVGGQPRRLTVPGHDLKGVRYIRQLDDNRTMDVKGKKVVVVGASFIGMESASLWRKEAASVTVICNDSVPFKRTLGEPVGRTIMKLFEANDTKIETNSSVEALEGADGTVTHVVLNGGRRIEADVVIAGIGMVPSTGFLRKSCVTVDQRGFIPVDDGFQTNVTDVFAIGDACAFPLPYFAGHAAPVNIQHYQMAEMHGRTAALILAGRKTRLHSTPFFWTLLFDYPVRFAGYSVDLSDYVLRGDENSGDYNLYYFRENKVVAVVSAGRENSQTVPFLELFHKRLPITRAQVEHANTGSEQNDRTIFFR
ncbi:hypothetical protein QR680_012427 [Steinernema hermaphroditum]|uniref:Rieske domain-containing protein n=1 Tax=Steinernema hermaphroditum TaxID=289476 RepID=A0AA39I3C0_9BILA|nr:hypothetical protein QR680_012427 [Steinernema hermaphroditum]